MTDEYEEAMEHDSWLNDEELLEHYRQNMMRMKFDEFTDQQMIDEMNFRGYVSLKADVVKGMFKDQTRYHEIKKMPTQQLTHMKNRHMLLDKDMDEQIDEHIGVSVGTPTKEIM